MWSGCIRIPHESLLAALEWVLDKTWAYHSDTPVLLVYEDSNVAHGWLPAFSTLSQSAGFRWFGQNVH
jgi:hypothetical protein